MVDDMARTVDDLEDLRVDPLRNLDALGLELVVAIRKPLAYAVGILHELLEARFFGEIVKGSTHMNASGDHVALDSLGVLLQALLYVS